MGSSQQFSLRWNNYLKHITSAFDTLRTDEDLVDVTLSCEGKRIRAHKMLLSACSTYFRDLFKENPCQHPVIIFRNVKFDDLAALVDFIYQGEVNVVQEQLDSFMTTAELLAVQGLTDGSRKDDSLAEEDEVDIPNEPEVQLRGVPGKVITNERASKSFHSNSQKSEAPPNKRRRCRENSNAHSEKSNRHNSPKDSDPKSDSQTTDPVEIIPLMPNLKVEMPEYMEQDGSSGSYDEHNDGSNKLLVDSQDILENDHKPDVSQTFYSNQSHDNLDATKSSDIGYLLSKPGTSSGDRESTGDTSNLLKSVLGTRIKDSPSPQPWPIIAVKEEEEEEEDDISDTEIFDLNESTESEKATELHVDSLIPVKSKVKYQAAYEGYMEWKTKNNADLSEKSLLTYFDEYMKRYKPSSAWATFSMIKSTLNQMHHVNIGKYKTLLNRLKENSRGFQSKKSELFSKEQVRKFIDDAPDEMYLLMKVVIIFGIVGRCRANELTQIRVKDVQEHGELYMVSIPETPVTKARKFTVNTDLSRFVKKYANLRPEHCPTNRFLLTYRNRKCLHQAVGKNKITSMAKEIASWLNLENINMYTGHALTRCIETMMNRPNLGNTLIDI